VAGQQEDGAGGDGDGVALERVQELGERGVGQRGAAAPGAQLSHVLDHRRLAAGGLDGLHGAENLPQRGRDPSGRRPAGAAVAAQPGARRLGEHRGAHHGQHGDQRHHRIDAHEHEDGRGGVEGRHHLVLPLSDELLALARVLVQPVHHVARRRRRPGAGAREEVLKRVAAQERAQVVPVGEVDVHPGDVQRHAGDSQSQQQGQQGGRPGPGGRTGRRQRVEEPA
jgi:hypothetical protein